MRGEQNGGWTPAQRRLHWWNAALVLLAFVVAWVMVAVPKEQLLEKFLLYQLHKNLGLFALAMLLGRLVLRLRRGRPPWDAVLPPWQRRAAATMHMLLYVLLATVPALGYLTAASAPVNVPTLLLGVVPVPHVIGPDAAWFAAVRPLHRTAALALATLACLHALAALHNALRRRRRERFPGTSANRAEAME